MYIIFFNNIMTYIKITTYPFAIYIKTTTDKMLDYTSYFQPTIICQSRK